MSAAVASAASSSASSAASYDPHKDPPDDPDAPASGESESGESSSSSSSSSSASSASAESAESKEEDPAKRKARRKKKAKAKEDKKKASARAKADFARGYREGLALIARRAHAASAVLERMPGLTEGERARATHKSMTRRSSRSVLDGGGSQAIETLRKAGMSEKEIVRARGMAAGKESIDDSMVHRGKWRTT